MKKAAQFFTGNRDRLAAELTGNIIALTGFSAMQQTNDAAARYEQESTFWYLTGIEMPGWWLIIDADTNVTWLVTPEIDDTHQVFDGALSATEATEISGISKVINREQASVVLRDLASTHDTVYTLGEDPHAHHYDFSLNPALPEMKRRLVEIFKTVESCRSIVAKQRALKQPNELVMMQQAIDMTIDAFKFVKQKLAQFQYEYEVEAEFTYHFRRHGSQGHAYEPIVAGGHNACTLHYGANNGPLQQGELLVLDIGARVGGYAADVTRTYAIGPLTERQKAVHKQVQLAQQKIIKLLGPNVSIRDYHDQVDTIMKRALVGLNLMADMSDLVAYRKYFPHAISHGLGIDVHDSLGAPEVLKPGMVVTVEPGIYIPEESIGVRIEDDILITEAGYTNLSAALSTDW